MKTSTDRILTTHTGSLPRPEGLALPGTDPAWRDSPAGDDVIRDAVTETVRKQVLSGIDVVSDGEVSKPSYSTYVTDRLTGFEQQDAETRQLPWASEFPEYFARLAGQLKRAMTNPVCIGPVAYRDHKAVQRDIANLQAAITSTGAVEGFMTAASPGVIAQFMANRYYRSHSELHRCPGRCHEGGVRSHRRRRPHTPTRLSRPGVVAGVRGERNDQGRFSGHGQRAHRRPERGNRRHRSRIDAHARLLGQLRGTAQPRHTLTGDHRPGLTGPAGRAPVRSSQPSTPARVGRVPGCGHPDGKILVPGVLDTTTNYIEHPELVAERIERLARLVGMDRVLAGTDCGFATFAHALPVDPRIVWAKLASMAEGAAIATDRLRH